MGDVLYVSKDRSVRDVPVVQVGAVGGVVKKARRFAAGTFLRVVFLVAIVVMAGFKLSRWGRPPALTPSPSKAVVGTPTPGTWMYHATPIFAGGQWVGWTVPIQTFTPLPVPVSQATSAAKPRLAAGSGTGTPFPDGVLRVVPFGAVKSPSFTSTPFVGLCVPPSCVWVTPFPIP